MFARIVSMRLKPNMTAEFTQTIEKRVLPILRRQRGFRDEITFITQVERKLWESAYGIHGNKPRRTTPGATVMY